MTNPNSRPLVDAYETPAMAASSTSTSDVSDKLVLLEETAEVSTREVITGTLRVSTRTERHEEVAAVSLDRDTVEVTRVPVGKLVDVAPEVRTDNGTTIVPVLEERFVVVKQLFLKEELHIRRHVDRDVTSVPVALKRQVAVVERLDAEGQVIGDVDGSNT